MYTLKYFRDYWGADKYDSKDIKGFKNIIEELIVLGDLTIFEDHWELGKIEMFMFDCGL